MPNWCSNTFSIKGPKAKIEALYNQAIKDEDNGGGLLQAMKPMPNSLHIRAGCFGVNTPEQKELEKAEISNLKDHGYKNWWDWRVTEWGTKWEVSTEGFEGSLHADDEGNAEINGWFDSAWAPPCYAFDTYIQKNTDVEAPLEYQEPGMCFVGRWEGANGISGDDYYDYSNENSDTVRELIGDDLDENWGISESMAEYEADLAEEEVA